jgi:hypothetical protein
MTRTIISFLALRYSDFVCQNIYIKAQLPPVALNVPRIIDPSIRRRRRRRRRLFLIGKLFWSCHL